MTPGDALALIGIVGLVCLALVLGFVAWVESESKHGAMKGLLGDDEKPSYPTDD